MSIGLRNVRDISSPMAKIKANANNCQSSARGQRYNFPGHGGGGGEQKG